MKFSDALNALPEPWRSLPSPGLTDTEGLQRLRESGWWSRARLRTYWCAEPNRQPPPHRLAELVEAPGHGAVLVVYTDGHSFAEPPPANYAELPIIDRMRIARQLRRQKIRGAEEVWSLENLRLWLDVPGDDELLLTAVCRCGRHVLDLRRVLSDHDAGDRRRVVLPKMTHSV